MSENAEFAEACADAGLVFDGPLLGRITHQPLLFLSRRLVDNDGAFAGIAYVTLTLNGLEAIFSNLDVGPGGLLSLRTAEMTLVTRHPRSEVAQDERNARRVSPEMLTQMAVRPVSGTFRATSPIDNIHRVFSYRRLEDQPFYVIVGQATEDFMAGQRRSAMLLSGLFAAVVLISVLAARHSYRSERGLKTAAARLAESLHQVEESNFLLATRTQQLDTANAALRHSEERYGYAMQASRDGIWDWDLQAGTAHLNPAYSTLLGYLPGELGDRIDACWTDTLHPDERACIRAEVEARLAAPGHYELEFRQRCKDGSYKWILSRGLVVARNAAGQPVRAVGTHVDITERKHNEIKLHEAKDAAEAASRAKSAFLANMSHELRTPLNGIMGMTALALRNAVDAQQRSHLGRIDQASHHLLEIIDDVLDISKIEAGRLSLDAINFSPDDLHQRLLSMLSPRAVEKGIDFKLEVAPDLAALSLRGDPPRLMQILLNLGGNAVKFTATGQVTVRARVIDETQDTVCLRYEIEDTGIGIAADTLPRLFAVFEQGDNSTSRRYGGTGLGLAISKRLVEMMDGEIGVDSTPGEGATFWFTVRLGKGVAPTPRPAVHDDVERRLRERHAGTRVLLAEDDPINQEVSLALLEDVGLIATLAVNGREAVDLAAQASYRLILLDMQMPELDGPGAARAIRRLTGYAATPILAMTANVFETDRQACQAAGMNDHVGKPVDPERLYAMLLRWLDAEDHADV